MPYACLIVFVHIRLLKRDYAKQRAVHYDTALLYGFTYLAEEHRVLIDGMQTGKYKYTLNLHSIGMHSVSTLAAKSNLKPWVCSSTAMLNE